MIFESNLIEGIGNEVILVMSVLCSCLFLAIAWMSTRVSAQLNPIRVFVLRHTESESESEVENVGESQRSYLNQSEFNQDIEEDIIFTESENSETNEEDGQNVDSTVRKRFSECTQSADESRLPGSGSLTRTRVEREEARAAKHRARGHIVIRLQYLDDRARFVHAAPDMLVSHFKRKYFRDELRNQEKNVRLIFQGRELVERDPPLSPTRYTSFPGPESQSNAAAAADLCRLCDYSVPDNATIHCLVTNKPAVTGNAASVVTGDLRRQQQRSSSMVSGLSFRRHRHHNHHHHLGAADQGVGSDNTGGVAGGNISMAAHSAAQPMDIDFGPRFLVPCLAVLLFICWIFRFTYRQYFDTLSTFSLFGLTVFFFVCLPIMELLRGPPALFFSATEAPSSSVSSASIPVTPLVTPTSPSPSAEQTASTTPTPSSDVNTNVVSASPDNAVVDCSGSEAAAIVAGVVEETAVRNGVAVCGESIVECIRTEGVAGSNSRLTADVVS